MLTTEPKILALAFLGGTLPSLLWLWFWFNEDRKRPEPKGLTAVIFIMGMIAVVFVLPIEKLIQSNVDHQTLELILWATTEELLKFIAVMLVVYKTNFSDEPIEWPIHLITAALGFAALENTLFLIKPLTSGATVVGLLTGQLRFLGATLLHTVASGILGIALGISFYIHGFKKFIHVIIGFIFAIALHSVFNFFIIKNNGTDFLKVFAFLWVVTIIIMLLFERVRRISNLS